MSLAAAVCLHGSTSTQTSWGECGGEVRRGCGRLSALPQHTYMSDPCPVPLHFFLICGSFTTSATRPQTHCLSLPPAPAPSSCRTMLGGFLRSKPREGEVGVGWHPRVKCGSAHWSPIAPGSVKGASTSGADQHPVSPSPCHSAKVCEEKLRYAAYNCVAIDTDMSPWEE